MNQKWDAGNYESQFRFVSQYGVDLLSFIDAGSGSTVLDLGCGNGSLSKILSEKGYQVIGLDASKEMLSLAKKACPEISFIQGDATDFSLKKPVEVIFSNAVFHWIDQEKQEKMLQCIYQALKPQGEFVFEMGGAGNNKKIHAVLKQIFEQHGYTYQMPFFFPSIGEYSALLEKAGFQVIYAILFDRMTELEGKNGLKEWIRMFINMPFEVVKSKKEKEEIIDQAVSLLKNDLYFDDRWHSDYVRLRMKAIRPKS